MVDMKWTKCKTTNIFSKGAQKRTSPCLFLFFFPLDRKNNRAKTFFKKLNQERKKQMHETGKN